MKKYIWRYWWYGIWFFNDWYWFSINETCFESFRKNILLLNIKNNQFEINHKTTKLKQILSFDNNKIKYDILGKIGLNALNDESKFGQFEKY